MVVCYPQLPSMIEYRKKEFGQKNLSIIHEASGTPPRLNLRRRPNPNLPLLFELDLRPFFSLQLTEK